MAGLGEWVPFGGDSVIVYSYELDEVGRVTQIEMEVEYESGDLGAWPVICYTTTDGEELEEEARSYIFGDGCATFRYRAMEMDPSAPCYAVFKEEFYPYSVVRIALN
jgi:hypothetical protein